MNPILAILILVATMIAGIAVLAIVYPFRPFRTRARALLSFLTSMLILGALGIAIAPEKSAKIPTAEKSTAAIVQSHLSSAKIPKPCGEGGLVLDDVVAVSGETYLLKEPKEKAARIKNLKASESLGSTHYHQIDKSTTVRRLCSQPDWTEVQFVTPDWLTDIHGWVPSRVLRTIGQQANGSRLYVAEDFSWDKDTKRVKAAIVTVVNKIARDNANCTTIDTGSLSLSPSRSKPNDPVFFITCESGAEVFNVWFRPRDAKDATTFAAKTPLDRNAATGACERAAKDAATHPSTVSFSRVWDFAYMPHVSGRARVVSSFTARNAFNLELKYRIDCLFDGSSLIETLINET